MLFNYTLSLAYLRLYKRKGVIYCMSSFEHISGTSTLLWRVPTGAPPGDGPWDPPKRGLFKRVPCDPPKRVNIMFMAINRDPLLVGTKRNPLF